jgi:hypothetical protein
MNMETTKKLTSRKRFIGWAAALAGFAAFFKFLPREEKKKNTVKMLTRDGLLVEVDRDMIAGVKRKITDPELKKWVKTK